ncbi:TIR domain-containing protein [Clostridioides sp. ZZV14-6153]|uniref:toll/interleukin-1 receptor domain-containing protein n=1 Tax=Clostridioides sp. ZZV14-6153 TaxID=2811494 RepID=UPI001D114801|nr:toll/interleukin-1 receptor domain-containing protein [Clostridioides sp. ZZV14-6153]
MNKPLIFISHITEESELAIEIKDALEEAFLDKIEIFVSSDGDCIRLGEEWIDVIIESLRKSAIGIILISYKSVERRWINFEAGAFWMRNIPIIPIYHSGITEHDVPIPINIMQGKIISELDSILMSISKEINVEINQVNITEFNKKVNELQEKYTFWDKVNENFEKIHNMDERITKYLKSKGVANLQVMKDELFNPIHNFLNNTLVKDGIITIERYGGVDFTMDGTVKNYRFTLTTKGKEIVQHKNFKF